MLIPWVVFPLVLAALCLGAGLLVAAAASWNVPGPLLLPVGFGVVSLTSQFAVLSTATASLAAPAVVVLAVAGFALALPRRPPLAAGVPAGVAVAVFAAFGAPVLASGRATFAGYIKLDDTATYFAMLDRALTSGYNLSGLPPSTYEATVATSLGVGYPLGSFLPLGIAHELVRADIAWLWQPYISFLAALTALGLYELAGAIVRSRALRALVACFGAQAALLYGYALWGGVKELATALLVVAVAALVVPAASARARGVLPLAVVCAAALGVESLGGGVWLVVTGLAFVLTCLVGRRTDGLVPIGSFALSTAVLAIPAADAAVKFLPATGSFTSSSELANLFHPLSKLQALGVWPSGDFRVDPHDLDSTYALLAIVALAAVAALVVAVRARAWGVLIAVATAAVGGAVYVGGGSPWIGGKALAVVSPVVLGLALVGIAAAFESGRRVEAVVAGLFVVGGVVWSNTLQYRAVLLAPQARLHELESIGKRFAGDGPTLLTQFDAYGARHFLRNTTAEAASELRRHYIFLRNGSVAPTGVSPDIDDIRLDQVLFYRLLVLPRSGSESRPPSVYRLVWRGRFYDVWERRGSGAGIVEHLSLGDDDQPAAVPSCSQVLRLGREAAAVGGHLAAVIRPAAVVIQGDGTRGTASTAPGEDYGSNPHSRYTTGPYTIEESFDVAAPGLYRVWIGGSFTAAVSIRIDGRSAGTQSGELNWPNNFVPFGRVRLARGRHSFRLDYAGPSLAPGSAAPPPFGLGPFVIAQDTDELPVRDVAPARARSLCGDSLDWLEAVR